jgi:hypothetical protein
MKKTVLVSFFIFLSTFAFSQAKMVMKDSIFMVIDNAAYLVIDNDSANALSTRGNGGGNILSEHENDVVKWNIHTTQGLYTIPWVTKTAIKIPYIINIKPPTAVGNGSLLFSTYETTSDLNISYPSVVTHMNSSVLGGNDASLFTVDRFWRVEPINYSLKPTATMEFFYDDNINEIGDSNTIVEANLRAQRFNTDVNDWEGLLFGKTNSTANRTYAVNINPPDFYAYWTLVDKTTPLPITLIDFTANCKEENVSIKWTTSSEINNDYFIIEKSYDAINFIDLTNIQGAGNSNNMIQYQVNDFIDNRTVFYRIKQVDFDASYSYSNIISTNCISTNFIVNQFSFNNNDLSFNINTSIDEISEIILYDIRGRKISSKTTFLKKGWNQIKLESNNLTKSIYMLSIIGNKNIYTTKLLKQ